MKRSSLAAALLMAVGLTHWLLPIEALEQTPGLQHNSRTSIANASDAASACSENGLLRDTRLASWVDGAYTTEVLDESTSREQFFKNVPAESIERLNQSLAARGWVPTGRFRSFVIRPVNRHRLETAAFSSAQGFGQFYPSGGVITVWEWDSPHVDTASGTIKIEEIATGAYEMFETTYDPYSDAEWGQTTYARYLELRDRDGRFTREGDAEAPLQQVFVPARANPALRFASWTPDADGPRFVSAQRADTEAVRQWKLCMVHCAKEKLDKSVRAGLYMGAAGVLPCARHAARTGAFGWQVALAVFVGCEIGATTLGVTGAMIHHFVEQPPCDSPSRCGPKPEVRP